jgi:hypothetical protein
LIATWSDALVTHDVEPDVVVEQARSEAGQVSATDPEDRTLHATRDLLSSMFLEYSKAVASSAKGSNVANHMQNAWRLANASHKLLTGAKDGSRRAGLRRVAAPPDRDVGDNCDRAARTDRRAHPQA